MGKFKAEPSGHRAAWVTEPTAEEVSLLMDGELEPDRVDSVCHGLREIGSMERWVCYHVIGDSLRGAGGAMPGFAARFAARLAAEPTVLAPRGKVRPAAVALAAAATVAAVGVVGWVAMTTMPASSGTTIATAIEAARQAAVVRAADARPHVDNQYLLMHQEYSPTAAIQGVRPYLRAVAAEELDARP